MSISTIKIDTLAIARELESAGIPSQQAEAQTRVYAKVINSLVVEQLANKQDLAAVEQKLLNKFDVTDGKSAEVNKQINAMYARINEIDIKINGMENQIERKMDGMEKQIEGKMSGMERQIERKMDGMEKRIERKMDEVGKQIEGKMSGMERQIESKIFEAEQRMFKAVQEFMSEIRMQSLEIIWSIIWWGVGVSLIVLIALIKLH